MTAPMPDPLPPPPPPVPGGDPIAAALRATVVEIQAIVARLESPARRDPSSAAVGLGIATPGGSVMPPVAAGKGPTPGPAVAVAPAACGSTGAVVAAGAGVDVPVEVLSPGRRNGRVGGGSGAATFSLPRPPEFSIGVGPLYDALPRWSR